MSFESSVGQLDRDSACYLDTLRIGPAILFREKRGYAVINRLSFFADGFVNRSMQCGCARCCIILQPDFLCL